MYIIEQGIAISNHDYRCYGEHGQSLEFVRVYLDQDEITQANSK